MATLRFFAQAKDAAGMSRTEIDAGTVKEVLDIARERFGPGLARVIESSAIWLNGEPADGPEAVGQDDEVAVLPPVSGG